MLKPLHCVVIDDRARFPLHIWRALGKVIGVGLGAVSDDGRVVDPGTAAKETWLSQTTDDEAVPLFTPDERVALWWIRPEDNGGLHVTESGPNQLQCVLKKLDSAGDTKGAWFLIDIRGLAGKHATLGQDRSRAERIYSWLLDSIGDAARIRLISSYSVGAPIQVHGKPVDVHPKSPDFLAELRREMLGTVPRRSLATPKGTPPIHVLVTGAGFEVLEGDARGSFGLPPTVNLLSDMARRLCRTLNEHSGSYLERRALTIELRLADTQSGTSTGYPLLQWHRGSSERTRRVWVDESELRRAANIDEYFDAMFLSDARAVEICTGELAKEHAMLRREKNLFVRERQRLIRDSLRSVLVDQDWGQMSQSVYAAGLPWDAWLTTNYTRWCDRAVALQQAHYDSGSEARSDSPWRVIATADEASLELRDYDDRRSQGRDVRDVRDRRRERRLFKLHGDIGRLHTMALAGEDKQPFSPLMYRVDSLDSMYRAARDYLELLAESGSRKPKPPLVVHVVGHGLWDEKLCRMLWRVRSEYGRIRMIVVAGSRPNPSVNANARGIVRNESDLLVLPTTAARYMQWLWTAYHRGAKRDEAVFKSSIWTRAGAELGGPSPSARYAP